MKQTWLLRAYKEGDEDEIFELTKAVWGKKVPEKERWMKGWKWMHIGNPAGASMMWLAEHDGKLTGQYPLILEDMKVGEEIIKSAQIVDTMVHPEYRRQGIAYALGKKALSELEKEEIQLVYGFPNQQAYPLHMKSGWLDVCPFQVMIKPLNLENIIEMYFTCKKLPLRILTIAGKLSTKMVFKSKEPPKVNGLTISQISHFDDRFNNFWQKVSSDYNMIVVRDKKYLNWRYIDVPNAKYIIYVAETDGEVHGYVILGHAEAKGLTFGYIHDIIAPLDQGNIIQCLISKGVEHFKEEKVSAIFSQMIPNKIYRNAFLKSGFIPNFISKNQFIVYNASSKFSQAFIKNHKNWFIQLGDLPFVY